MEEGETCTLMTKENDEMQDFSDTLKGDEKVTLLSLSKESPAKENSPSYQTFESTGEDIASDCPRKISSGKKNKPTVTLQLDIAAAAQRNTRKLSKTTAADDVHLRPQSANESGKPLKVAVFLKEGEGHLLHLEKGKVTSAGEIKTKMMEILSIHKSASNLFAIWMVSPYLEIQLKSHHIPYLLRKQWRDMLIEFSPCQDQVLATNDEPVLVFQRNSFCSVEDEYSVTEETAVKRLFAEAKHNFITAKYAIKTPDVELLGGYLTYIELGAYDLNNHKPGYLRKRMSEFLPYYAIGSNKIIQQVKIAGVEQRLTQQHERISKEINNVKDAQYMFLDYCRSLPYYGSAFFHGKILSDTSSWKIWKSKGRNLLIGINRNGITLFKEGKHEVLIHLPYDDFSWEYLKEDGSIDVLCIEYDLTDADGENIAHQLQLMSYQACMMDAIVDSCVNLMNVLKIPKTPTTADYSKLMDLSYCTDPNKKNNFTLSRPIK